MHEEGEMKQLVLFKFNSNMYHEETTNLLLSFHGLQFQTDLLARFLPLLIWRVDLRYSTPPAFSSLVYPYKMKEIVFNC